MWYTFSCDAVFEIDRSLDCVLIGRSQPEWPDVSVSKNLLCVRVSVDKPSVSLIFLTTKKFINKSQKSILFSPNNDLTLCSISAALTGSV